MSERWIKTYIKLADWEWYKDSGMVHLFIHLLIKANHKERRYKGVLLERGQLLTSRRLLRSQTGISERTIRTCLERLKSTHEVTIKTTQRNSIITICNYEHYQEKNNTHDPQNDPQNAHELTQERPSITIEYKNNNKKEKYKKEKKNTIPQNDIDEIYQCYPNKCQIRGASSGKCAANKEQIKKLMMEGHTKEKLMSIIKQYVDDCVKTHVYMKNFKTFLNNLPDYDEVQPANINASDLPVNDAGFRNFQHIDPNKLQ